MVHKYALWGMGALGIFFGGVYARLPKWDWHDIARNNYPMAFPAHFSWGSAGSDFQLSGSAYFTASNWFHWESLHAGGKITEASGDACGFYERCFQDIDLIKRLGCDSFRISVEWSAIEPEHGVIDMQALERYIQLVKALRAAGIEPMVTLHHFVHPEWFERKGGFEKASNIAYFVEYSRLVFSHLSPYVKRWCTINEPNIYALGGYVRGVWPPGYTLHFAKASTVLYNLLQAHTQVYHALKAMERGPDCEIGIVHQWLQFISYHETGLYGFLERYVAHILNQILHESVMSYFLQGEYHCHINVTPLSRWLPQGHFHVDEVLPGDTGRALDFFGINYYSCVPLKLRHNYAGEGYYEYDIKTDMPYAFYPEGLYDALMQARALNVPIYITENGIADARDDRRDIWINQHLYAVSQAIQDGAPVKGFYYWSLMDNFEWDMGYPLKFGLYHVDLVTKERTLRPGSLAYSLAIARHKKCIGYPISDAHIEARLANPSLQGIDQ